MTTIETFRARVAALYDDMRIWIANEEGLSASVASSVIRESVGEYEIERLLLSYSGCTVAEIAPVGASVVASAGRVDVLGSVDRAMLLYFESEPAIRSVLTDDSGRVVRNAKYRLFRGYLGPGWYWAIDARHREARRFDEAAFLEVLAEVSDFDVERD